MNGFLELTLVLLCGLIMFEAVSLRHVLRETVSLKEAYVDSHHKVRRLETGSPAPWFSARSLGTDTIVRASDLRGANTILLFVFASESVSYPHLTTAIHGLLHKAEGRLYVICSGSEQQCRQLASDHRVQGHPEDQITILLDDLGEIRKKFMIHSSTEAVILDEDLRLVRYGRPVAEEPAIDLVNS